MLQTPCWNPKLMRLVFQVMAIGVGTGTVAGHYKPTVKWHETAHSSSTPPPPMGFTFRKTETPIKEQLQLLEFDLRTLPGRSSGEGLSGWRRAMGQLNGW